MRKEILAHNMAIFFRNTGINATCTYKQETQGNRENLEVWSLDSEDFKKMCDMTEEEFARNADSDSWWRSAKGSVMGCPDSIIEINGVLVKAWTGNIARRRKYHDLLTYFCDALGASQPKNVCALAVDMAKYNGMSMAELFQKLQG